MPEAVGSSRGPASRTCQAVEKRLIAAFRAMPSCPVFAIGGRVSAAATGRGAVLAEVLTWSAMLHGDPAGRRYLWAWARCQATRSSFAELCDGMGWARPTAEAGRRRAAAAIAAALAASDAPMLHLDSEKTAGGVSPAAGNRPAPADA